MLKVLPEFITLKDAGVKLIWAVVAKPTRDKI